MISHKDFEKALNTILGIAYKIDRENLTWCEMNTNDVIDMETNLKIIDEFTREFLKSANEHREKYQIMSDLVCFFRERTVEAQHGQCQ